MQLLHVIINSKITNQINWIYVVEKQNTSLTKIRKDV